MANRFHRLTKIISITVAAILLSAFALSCSSKEYSGPPESITIGTTANDNNALIYIAKEMGYFSANGLDLTIKTYPSGKAALDGMMNGEVQMSTSAEYALAENILSGRNIQMIANINRRSSEYLVSRLDRGIVNIPDIKGKKVGVLLNSRLEFALDRFLYLNGIDSSSITPANVPVEKSVDALANGEVDAAATWQPYIDRIKDRLSGNVVAWSSASDQPSFNGVMSTAEWITQNKGLVNRFVKSLLQAEDYNLKHHEEVKAIIRKILNFDEEYIATVWPENTFSITLDQSLIIAMEDEARWMIKNNLTTEKQVPDFNDYIYENALKSLKPGAVNIIR